MDVRTPIATNSGDWATRFGEHWKTQVAKLQEKFGPLIEGVRMPQEYPTDVPILYVKKDAIVQVLAFMKTDPGFEYAFLSDITATDEESEPRFEVVYNLYSMTKHCRIRLKTKVAEGDAVPSAIPVWPGADWAEREVFDMYGVKFSGHPDLRRILMDVRFQGHPLRKDYPLRGYQIFTEPEAVDTKLLD